MALPEGVYTGEHLTVRGSLLISDNGTYSREFTFCHIETRRCDTTGFGAVSGPGLWIGYAGAFHALEPGTYRVTWRLFAPWGNDATRVVARLESRITAHVR